MLRRFLICAIAMAYANMAHAGAWLQPEGQGQLFTQLNYYTTNKYFDVNGNLTSQKRYKKIELQPYVEYGVDENLTLGGSIYPQRDSQFGHNKYGVADPEFFARTMIWKNDHNIVSLQPLIKLPSLYRSDESTPRGGSTSMDAELSVLYGRNVELWSKRDYVDSRIGYRTRLNGLNDQIRADAVLGIQVTDDWQIMPALRAVIPTKSDDAATFSENGDQDYGLLKLELGASYRLDEKTGLQFAAFSHVAGLQTGDGFGFTGGFMRRF